MKPLQDFLTGRVASTGGVVRCGLTRAAREVTGEIDASLARPLALHARSCARCSGDERRARLVATGLARMAREREQAPAGFVDAVVDRLAWTGRPEAVAMAGSAVWDGRDHARRVAIAGAGAIAAAGLAVAARRRLGPVS